MNAASTLDSTSVGAVCPFCSISEDRIFFRGQFFNAVWDAYPVSRGHALLVSKRHVVTWFDTHQDERNDMIAGVSAVRDIIEARHSPDGYNIGINVGKPAGQTVFHLHIHVIPRYHGDVADPTGGVRNVIPGLGNYQPRT